MRPDPRSAMSGPNAWPSRNGAVRLIAIVASQSAGDMSSMCGRRLMPAALTKMSGTPKSARTVAVARSRAARSASVVEGLRVSRDEDDARPGLAECGGDAAPDAGTTSRYYGGLAREPEEALEV
ncbi:unnamed protein product [Parascedosporium putredinis]|uniref:Uncharacterized protein n=1 Tax=Parascedosporium putredinis TaxID=1442378 RepID=A0A9P1MFJ8_9PEZI|nr:unnamed protein product [Parascedosporium putredinis]CAI8005170.1 unnamed protein product [Parascedosporium putredinis]